MASISWHINMAEGTPKLEISSSHSRVHTLESGPGGAAVRHYLGRTQSGWGSSTTASRGMQARAARGSIRALAVCKQTLTAETWGLRGLNHLQSSEAIETQLQCTCGDRYTLCWEQQQHLKVWF